MDVIYTITYNSHKLQEYKCLHALITEQDRVLFELISIDPVSQLIWTPVDLDPRSISTSRYGPPGPNLLADMAPRGSKSTSKYGPPLADLDPPSKVKYM
jgi:hypothetical protein